MDQKQPRNLRLYILAGLFLAVMAVFLGVLYDTQVNDYETYYASSVRSIARSEPVEAAVDGDVTLKRLFHKDGKIVLHPENRQMKDIIVEHCEVQGVLVSCIKMY